ARFAQRVAQALGRCNRAPDDRAAYILTDGEFLARFSERRALDALPDDVRGDVYAGVVRSDAGMAAGLASASAFLDGGELDGGESPPPRVAAPDPPATAAREVEGMLRPWRADYGR